MTSPVLSTPAEVLELLSGMGKGRVLFVACDGVHVSPICKGHAVGERSSEHLFGEGAGNEFGHVTSWVDAGDAFETLLPLLMADEGPDLVVFLDPWVASFLSRLPSLPRIPRWAYVERESTESDREYWSEMDRWLGELPFSTRIPRALWKEAIAQFGQPVGQPAALGDKVFASRPGSWEWRRLGPRVGRRDHRREPITLISRYSGSLLHMKLFLESLSRQDYPLDRVSLTVLTNGNVPELDTYLRWFSLAHSSLQVSVLDISSSRGGGWTEELDRCLQGKGASAILLLSDRALLPAEFLRLTMASSASSGKKVAGLPMDREASAHIITGNLDPIAHYEEIAKVAVASRPPDRPWADSGRLLPRSLKEAWGPGLAQRVLEYVREDLGGGELLERPETERAGEPLLVLEIGDLT